MVIIFGLYINNMPVNFRFNKIVTRLFEYITGPGGEFNIETANKIGITDPNSKAYKIVSWFVSFVKSAISPSYKTMLFKTILTIFLIGVLTGITYSNMFLVCNILILVISIIFYLIFKIIDFIGIKPDKSSESESESETETLIISWRN